MAWIRFHDDKESLQVWDFHHKKLVLDCDVTLPDKNLDYAGLSWSEDAKQLLAVLNDKRVHIYDRKGTLVEKRRVIEGKAGLELASGKRLHKDIKQGLIVRKGTSRIRIALEPREFEKGSRHEPMLARHLLTFTDLASGKKESVKVVLDLPHPPVATVSKDGRYLALVDESRLRIWEVDKRRELEFAHAFPKIDRMVISPGGTYVQFQRDPVRNSGTPWHSLNLDNGRLRRLDTPSPTDRITLGLGATGFAVGKDLFIGITGRSVDRWDLKTGRRLNGTQLPDTPHDKEVGRPYDECLLLEDGFRLIQFTCVPKRNAKSDVVYQLTWRPWSPGQKESPLRLIPDCTWQRGAAALPHGRFLYFATPPAAAKSKDTEVQPGVTLRQRGEMQLYFGRLDRPDSHHMAAFSGYWCTLRGVSRGGQLLLMSESSSTWIQTSRNSQSTWFDPAAQRHCLLEFHTGAPVADSKTLGKLLGDRASYLSADGRFLLIAKDKGLQLYEPHVLGKVVKEFPLPATPQRFAVSKDGTRIACQLSDTTLMIWDGERLARFVNEAIIRERPKDLNRLVDELASSPQAAYRAARLLAAAGDSGVTVLRRAMDGKPPDARQIAGWIRDLDSDQFATRNKAESSLAAWGTPVEKLLRDAMNANPSAEKRLRLRRLLSRFARSPYGNRELGQVRAVLALDWNGSPVATRLLAEWARKYRDSPLGEESKLALASRAAR